MSRTYSLTLFTTVFTALLLTSFTVDADVNARYRTTQADFGGVGLLQTPTARMAEDGSLSFNANRVAPYSRYSISAQPLSWLEATIRYTAITNRDYGPEDFSGDQSFKDKGIDFKVQLLNESYWRPQVAFGMRDIGGTGLFSSEYFVANKRAYDFDFSLGLAWGYIGNRGGISNPLGLIRDSFNDRGEVTADVSQAGDLRTNRYFRGPIAIFGGVEYQTPWQRLRAKVELDGNDYGSEPLGNNLDQDYPINLGVIYRLGQNVNLTAAVERGNTAMFGISYQTNIKTAPMVAKFLDPLPEVREQLPAGVRGNHVDWADVSRRLSENAGVDVHQIAVHDNELIVTGEQTHYRNRAQGISRAARVLDNSVGAGTYDWYTLVYRPKGVEVSQTSIKAETLRRYERNEVGRDTLRRAVINAVPDTLREDTLFEAPLDRYTVGTSLGYKQNVGGPDGFLLYQFLLRLNASYYFNDNRWVDGELGANLLNNYDKFKYDAPSNLPRVRTDLRSYATSSDVQLSVLQYTETHRLDRDLYAMGYAGLLEWMYGGVGGELLYRPFGANWALGADINWVKQRGFKQDFSFRDYSTLTGHITGYMQTGFNDVLAKGSIGRYLAGDYGGTLDLSRRFRSGFTIGAWATITNVSAEEFGEGSFDKGFYLRVPFDAFFARSTTSTGTLVWNPLTRDGGARLGRSHDLYGLTSDRDLDQFNDGFRDITR